jgi:hypothetical protein
MRATARTLFLAACCVLAGCVDLTAVSDFAKESSIITANKSMLDDTAAQTEAHLYAPNNFADPTSKAFTDRLAITNKALAALNGYMSVLAQLSASGVANVSSDYSTIGSGLKSLGVTDPSVQPAINAASALTNIVLAAILSKDVKMLITSAAQPVDQITAYLVDQAQTTSNTYNQAIAVNNRYWGELTQQTKGDARVCRTAALCKAIYVLVNRAHATDVADLTAKAAAADAAVTAFKKIQTDNAALVANVNELDAKSLIAILKADEPYLLAAINNLKAL